MQFVTLVIWSKLLTFQRRADWRSRASNSGPGGERRQTGRRVAPLKADRLKDIGRRRQSREIRSCSALRRSFRAGHRRYWPAASLVDGRCATGGEVSYDRQLISQNAAAQTLLDAATPMRPWSGGATAVEQLYGHRALADAHVLSK